MKKNLDCVSEYRRLYHDSKNKLWQLVTLLDFIKESISLNNDINLPFKTETILSINEIEDTVMKVNATLSDMHTHALKIIEEHECNGHIDPKRIGAVIDNSKK